ncbi:hypothetical protein DMB66_32670 [Actinoplanes sp. ATCC 53533]|uniref:hypothetical protein n=1 Tax=Actinoplanes sp. ATCC 53533 TaxID=1288362 RepID=UPI000F7A0DBF|nr:hypothetical protein [Actinoplanes sp. ATCC 53533]RSM56832.1 hypothetical protein DMB66_32670 [Actinoplanes sp. ATCC 53533]
MVQSPDVNELLTELQREFGTAADIATALPVDTPVTVRVPLLAERIRIAAASTDRLLAVWTHSPADPQRVEGCANRVRRIAAAVITLHDTLVVAAREPACQQAAQRVQRAAAQLDEEVDALYVETTTPPPPRGRLT